MKDVELVSVGDAIFRAKLKCPHCQAPNAVEVRNSTVSIVMIDGVQLRDRDENTTIRTL